jgi:carbonic anhydrase
MTDDKILWSYSGDTGPEKWGELSPAYSACKLGRMQSPIDLGAAEPKKLPPLLVNYGAAPLHVRNTGRTIEVVSDGQGAVYAFDGAYHMSGFHFHAPGEHVVNGERFPLEVHFVHQSPGEGRAELAAFYKVGDHNANMDVILDNLPGRAGEERKAKLAFNPLSIITKFRVYYTYYGSLTEPPCSENVLWLALKKPSELSEAQLEKFTTLLGQNSRPLQPLNDRKVWISA